MKVFSHYRYFMWVGALLKVGGNANGSCESVYDRS